MNILNLFWFGALRGLIFHTTIPPRIISSISMNKATEYSKTYFVSFFEKNQTVSKFSSTQRTAYLRVVTNKKCVIHRNSVSSAQLDAKQRTAHQKNAFSWLSDRPNMNHHTISSGVVLKALSCHHVERLLRLHSGMPKILVTLTQKLKLRVRCNDSLCK